MMPTTSVRRLMSPLSRTTGFTLRNSTTSGTLSSW
jgi:hypothetical protein